MIIIPALVSLYVQCIVSSYVSYKMLMNVLGIMVAVNKSASIKMDHSIAHACWVNYVLSNDNLTCRGKFL